MRDMCEREIKVIEIPSGARRRSETQTQVKSRRAHKGVLIALHVCTFALPPLHTLLSHIYFTCNMFNSDNSASYSSA